MKQTLWKEYFNFSRQERTGITVLLVLISICVSVSAAWEYFYPPITEGEIITDKGWVRPGVTPHKQFKQKEHIHGVTAWKRDTVWKKAVWKKDSFYANKKLIISINSADSSAWTSLPGIGPALSSRIIRFRNKLGGFYSISQIREIYGLRDSTFVKIQPYLQLDTVSLKNLDINQLDEKSLAQHPYIHYKLARLIVLYRNNNGPFRHVRELLEIPLVDDSIYRKLEPYIKTIK